MKKAKVTKAQYQKYGLDCGKFYEYNAVTDEYRPLTGSIVMRLPYIIELEMDIENQRLVVRARKGRLVVKPASSNVVAIDAEKI
jgi:hypothetical protein